MDKFYQITQQYFDCKINTKEYNKLIKTLVNENSTRISG